MHEAEAQRVREITEQLSSRVAVGNALLHAVGRGEIRGSYRDVRRQMNQWHTENTFCLKRYVADPELQKYYRNKLLLISPDDWGWHSKVASWLADRITELETIDRLLRDHGLGPDKNPLRRDNPSWMRMSIECS